MSTPDYLTLSEGFGMALDTTLNRAQVTALTRRVQRWSIKERKGALEWTRDVRKDANIKPPNHVAPLLVELRKAAK